MQAIMISIKPKWCAKIMNGKKMYDENWNTIWEVIEQDGPYFDKE